MVEERFVQGNEACALGAIAANCRFFAGYPITPSTEIAEQMSILLPKKMKLHLQELLSELPGVV